MSKHLQIEIDHLHNELMSMCAAIEERVTMATSAFQELDRDLAERVIEMDREIDAGEVKLEEECLKVLALHQPVAIDLRVLVATVKINNDLERIGDLAVNIAKRALKLAKGGPFLPRVDFTAIVGRANGLLRKSIDSLVRQDVRLAREVMREDEEIDNLNREVFEKVEQALAQDGADPIRLFHLVSVSRHLERIADHATNIAEDVIYMVSGDIVRHPKLAAEAAKGPCGEN